MGEIPVRGDMDRGMLRWLLIPVGEDTDQGAVLCDICLTAMHNIWDQYDPMEHCTVQKKSRPGNEWDFKNYQPAKTGSNAIGLFV